MAKNKAKDRLITLACSVCKNRNYHLNKSRGKIPNPPKLELEKFCSTCRKHTLHVETK